MFYFILAIMLVLYYLFVAPQHIKGTLNVIIILFILVGFFIFIVLGFLKVMEFPTEMWLTLFMIMLGGWAIRDIELLDKKKAEGHKKPNSRSVYRSK